MIAKTMTSTPNKFRYNKFKQTGEAYHRKQNHESLLGSNTFSK